MKRVFALLLCVMLVVACFSGCGVGDEEEQILETQFDNHGYSEWRHTLGDLHKLSAGMYDVKLVSYTPEGALYAIEPGYLIVTEYVKDNFKSYRVLNVDQKQVFQSPEKHLDNFIIQKGS